jgi:GT2 family glycosyltransferase
MTKRIAILVPVFNAGALLADTLASPALAGLPSDSYAILVSDNCSTDGSTNGLGEQDAQGAQILLRRNETNLGRVGNWNRAMEWAEELGFSHALFLMAGDVLADATVIELRDRMVAADAALGIAPYRIVDEHMRPVRVARRIRSAPISTGWASARRCDSIPPTKPIPTNWPPPCSPRPMTPASSISTARSPAGASARTASMPAWTRKRA